MNMVISERAEKELTQFVDTIVSNNQWNGDDDWFDYEYEGDVVDVNIWRDDDGYVRASVFPTYQTPNGLTTDIGIWYNLSAYKE